MASRYDFIESVIDPALKMTVKGFVEKDFINSFIDGNESIINIPDGFQYRPDNLSQYYYNDPTYYWIFYYVNNLEKGIEDFCVGKELIVPNPKTVRNILGE